MASVEQCRAALHEIARRLGDVDEEIRQRHAFDRTLSCLIRDLDVVFSARVRDGLLEDITTEGQPTAQVRLSTSSEDLLDLVDGRLSVASAWAHGRLRIEAGVRDLLRLRSLL
jgi:putative sterol carrier protein